MHKNTLKNLSWAMVFILFISFSGIPQNAAYAQKTAHLNEEDRKRAAEKLENLFDALEEAAKEIPRDTFDPKAIVEKVGTDPQKLFEWVRDNTYLVPYRGSLRGPIGVVMDRLGNSLDRSLLLISPRARFFKRESTLTIIKNSRAKVIEINGRPCMIELFPSITVSRGFKMF